MAADAVLRDAPPARWSWKIATAVLAGVALVAVTGRLLVENPIKHTVFDVFHMAGQQWAAGGDYYGDPVHVFRWSPTAAACFVPWSLLPERTAEVLWRWTNAAVLAAGLGWWVREFLAAWPSQRRWLLAFALGVGALANINNGQVNPLMLAAILAGFVAARRERWNLCAALFAVTAALKVYPLALGMLLAALHPRRLALRLATATAVGFALAFVCQRPAYVAEQYRQWATFLRGDLRLELPLEDGYRDLWSLLRLCHVAVPQAFYFAIQLGSGAAAAAYCWWLARRRGRHAGEDAALTLGLCWCMLCGPATEPVTYLLLLPVALRAVLDPAAPSGTARMLAWTALGLLAVAEMLGTLSDAKYLNMWGFQPVAALLLTVRTVAFPPRGEEARHASDG